MDGIYTGTGTVLDDGTIRLDDAKGLPTGRVRITIEAALPQSEQSYADVPPAPGPRMSVEEILSDLHELRDEWDD